MLKSAAYHLGRLYGRLPRSARVIVVGLLLVGAVWALSPSDKSPSSMLPDTPIVSAPKTNAYEEAVRQSKEDPVGHAKAEGCWYRATKEAEALNEAYKRENPGRMLNEKEVYKARYRLCMMPPQN